MIFALSLYDVQNELRIKYPQSSWEKKIKFFWKFFDL